MGTEGAAPLGRRERKKAATRARLIECACRLIDAQGYDATSLNDITEAADVSARTFYLYFDSKADVALAGFHEWVDALVATMEARPEDEAPDLMLARSLKALHEAGYTSGNTVQENESRPMLPVLHALQLAESSPEVAGGVYQSMVSAGDRLSTLFGRRLAYPTGSAEPEMIAGAVMGAFASSQRAFAALTNAGGNPGPIDALTVQCFARFSTGLRELWAGRTTSGAGPL